MNKNKKYNDVVFFRITKKQHDKLKIFCTETKIDKSQLLRMLIKEYLKDYDETNILKKKEKGIN